MQKNGNRTYAIKRQAIYKAIYKWLELLRLIRALVI